MELHIDHLLRHQHEHRQRGARHRCSCHGVPGRIAIGHDANKDRAQTSLLAIYLIRFNLSKMLMLAGFYAKHSSWALYGFLSSHASCNTPRHRHSPPENGLQIASATWDELQRICSLR